MPTVTLTCTYDSANSAAWTNGANISTNNNTSATISATSGSLTKLGFTTDAASVIPVGATIVGARMVLRARISAGTGYGYLKDPGSYPDGGTAAHSILYNTTLTTYTSIDLGSIVYSSSWLSGYIRLTNDSGTTQTQTVDYLAFEIDYVMPGSGNAFFFGENF